MRVFEGGVCVVPVLLLFVRLGLAGWAGARPKGLRCLDSSEDCSIIEKRWGLEFYKKDIVLQRRTQRPRESR